MEGRHMPGGLVWRIGTLVALVVFIFPAGRASATAPGSDGVLLGADGQITTVMDAVSPDGALPFRVWKAPLYETSPLYAAWYPAVSPKGVYVAFSRFNFSTPTRLFVMRWNGTDLRALPIFAGAVTWSPSGRLIYEGRGATDQTVGVWSARRDGSDAHRLFTLPVSDAGRIVYQPTGRWIAVLAAAPGDKQGRIWLVHPNGSDLHALAGDGGLPQEFDFSPDGSRIIFTEETPTYPFPYFIKTMNLEGADVRTLAEGIAPAYSPTGRQIAYQTGSATNGLWVMRSDGSHKHAVASQPGRAFAAGFLAWQPLRPTARTVFRVSTHLDNYGGELFVTATISPRTERDQRFRTTLYLVTPDGWQRIYERDTLAHKHAMKTWFSAPAPRRKDRCIIRIHFDGSPTSRPATAFRTVNC
jgi:Tol biopolymer transport system component